MGNFGCCQGKPQTIEESNSLPIQEQVDKLPEIENKIIEPEPIEQQNPEPESKKPKKHKKNLSSVDKSNIIRRPSDMVKISREDFVQYKKENIENSYLIISLLGKGSFGCVYKAQNKLTQALRAVKVLKKLNLDENVRTKLLYEVEILKSLNHPNILKVFEVYEDTISINIITDLCTGGELFDKIVSSKGFSENKAALYMYQIISAVKACHEKGIVHRDLKPENILFIDDSESSSLKVIDFGTSKRIEENSTLSSLTGTAYYIAPEVIQGSYDHKCDIWSCGVILYIMLCGYPPFRGSNDKIVMSNITKGYFSFTGKEWSSISTEAKSLIMKMLTKNPSKRPSAAEVFADPWVQSRFNNKQKDNILAVRSLKNLSHFRASRQLQKLVMEYLADQLSSSKETEHLRTAFVSLDTNGDGKLSVDELKKGFKLAGFSAHDLNSVIESCDGDGNGFIDYTEFLAATINWKKVLNREKLEFVFRAFDKDANGTISVAELQEFFGDAGNSIEDEVWKEMMNEADLNGDGQMDLEEFMKLMLK